MPACADKTPSFILYCVISNVKIVFIFFKVIELHLCKFIFIIVMQNINIQKFIAIYRLVFYFVMRNVRHNKETHSFQPIHGIPYHFTWKSSHFSAQIKKENKTKLIFYIFLWLPLAGSKYLYCSALSDEAGDHSILIITINEISISTISYSYKVV